MNNKSKSLKQRLTADHLARCVKEVFYQLQCKGWHYFLVRVYGEHNINRSFSNSSRMDRWRRHVGKGFV